MSELTKAADEKFCSECGKAIKLAAEICPMCGVRQSASAYPGGKQRVTAAILAFLLGGLGVHKFYLGQTGLGILYLVFFWTFIPGIIAFVEFIILLTQSDEQFNAKYNAAS